MSRKYLLSFALASIALLAASTGAQETEGSKMELKPEEEVAVLDTTKGTIVVAFFPDVAPGHVENFKKLSKEKFYDGVKFHRVIRNFMIQCGDPLTKDDDQQARWGTGGPGYTIKAEFNDKPHLPGTLSMARTADPNSAGSQFFICHKKVPHLDGQYTVFGQVAEGMDVVNKIAETETGARDVPVEPISIKTVKLMKWQDYKDSKDGEKKEDA